jgi:hypothetical protein
MLKNVYMDITMKDVQDRQGAVTAYGLGYFRQPKKKGGGDFI